MPKVGEKTAVGLVAGLGSLEDIYANLDGVKTLSFRGAKTLAPKLEEHKEQAFLSKELATIKCDVELEFGLTELKSADTDKATLLGLFRDLEFKAWIAELSDELGDEVGDAGTTDTSTSNKVKAATNTSTSSSDDDATDFPEVFLGKGEYEIILEQADLDRWVDLLKSSSLFAFDTETTSLSCLLYTSDAADE